MLSFGRETEPKVSTILPKLGRKRQIAEPRTFAIADQNTILDFLGNNDSLRKALIQDENEPNLVLITKLVRLYQVFSIVGHKQSDSSDFELSFEGAEYLQLMEEISKYIDLGDLNRLLTKRFIKTIRGSSYEVDLRQHESVSLLNNIKNQLLKEIFSTFTSLFLDRLECKWTGKPLKVYLVESISITQKSDYECLAHDHYFMEICRIKKASLECTSVSSEVLSIVKEKTQLKFVDFKSLESQVHKLESCGHLRPNINNQQGYIGLRYFPTMSYFKMYSLDDCLSKNSSYLSKDAEDKFVFLGVGLDWLPPLCLQLQKALEDVARDFKFAGKVTFNFVKSDLQLKDRIFMRHIRSNLDTQAALNTKFFRNLKIVAKKALAAKSLCKITGRMLFQKFRSEVSAKEQSDSMARAKAFFSALHQGLMKQQRTSFLSNLKLGHCGLNNILKVATKYHYLCKLARRAESFLIIKRWDQRKAKFIRSVKIGDNILKGLIGSCKQSIAQAAFRSIERTAKMKSFVDLLTSIFDREAKGLLRESLEELKDNVVQRKNQDLLKSQSLASLRRNYLLNNVCFILKYHQSLQEQLHQRFAFNQIKLEAARKKSSEDRVRRFVNILDSAMKKGIIRITQNSLKSRMTTIAKQNFKVGFHFLEMYILRKTLTAAFGAIKDTAETEQDHETQLKLAEEYHASKKVTQVFRLIRAMVLLRKRLTGLTAVVEEKRSILKRHFGKNLLVGMKAIHSLYKAKVEQRILMANKVISRVAQRRLLASLKTNPKPVKPSIRVPLIKLELILLKAIKQAYQVGFYGIHKTMVKRIHSATQVKLAKVHRAASAIQSLLKMTIARAWFKRVRAAVKTIQRHYRKLRQTRKTRIEAMHSKLVKQRQRLSEIRETAMLRLKEHLNSQMVEQTPAQTPNRPRPVESFQKKEDIKPATKKAHCENIVQTANKLHQIGQRRLAMGKENDFSFLQVRQPASMMKLNMDSNNRENIKRYKQKVITNHIKQKEKEFVFEEVSGTSDHFQSSNLVSTMNHSSVTSNCSNENLQDLILGVKTKIQQIRQTQRSKK